MGRERRTRFRAYRELTVTLNRRVVLGPLGIIASGLAKVIGKLFVWR